MPFDLDFTTWTVSAILEEDVTSSVMSVMLGKSARCDILERERAVAKT